MRRAGLAWILLAATVSMTMAEFMEFQKLSPGDLRARFGLPPACDPSVTALTSEPAGNRVNVAVECRAKPEAPSSTAPGGKPRPAAPR